MCISTRDTRCDSCSNTKATINDDFLKKCDWRRLVGTLDPRNLDLDDTRFDIEVIDLKSKELPDGKSDGSQEFGSNEEDIDRLVLLSQPEPAGGEEDITVDDPEIDQEQPLEQKEEEKDVSKEQDEEIARIMAARQAARHEIAELSKRLQDGRQTQNEDDDEEDDDEDDVGLDIGRRILHPIRPMPQMMPGQERSIHVEPEDDIVRPDEPAVNNFPPSYHNYPIESLSHAGDTQRRKAIVLLVLTCAIVLSTLAFVVCYVKEYCRRRGGAYNRVLVVNLTPEEREIVRQSAQALETIEKPPKRFRGSDRGYSAIVDRDPEEGVYVTENPLEAYLNATDERHVAKESLVENEVLDDHHVHRR